MASIDRADWHYGGDFPKHLSNKNGGTHIGMFLNWIIDNNLIGEIHLNDSAVGISKVKSQEITGTDFLFQYCDERLWEEDFNEEGLAFTKQYYLDPNDPDGGFGQYLDDYSETVGEQYEVLYEIPDTRANYEKIATQISIAYDSWKTQRNSNG